MRHATILLSLACAMFMGVATGSPQDSCKDLASFVQESSRLPSKPDEDGVVTYVSGSTAKKMFPGAADRLSIFRKYTFVAYFNLGLDIGLDFSLAQIWNYLPNVAVKAGISRGYEKVTISGVNIKDGELKQECLVSPGWYCTAYIRLDDFDSGEVIVDDRIRDEKFFPASLNAKPLYSDVWLDVPKAPRRVNFYPQ
ncbi:hypothetical protein B0O80DRAFT_36607 [Mortierella sp. GBAus27b]|nr:hypothetical protein B0O80DRAFT_36607 [Mortierella sp. GBAus27b]